jgi:hypothetical protein
MKRPCDLLLKISRECRVVGGQLRAPGIRESSPLRSTLPPETAHAPLTRVGSVLAVGKGKRGDESVVTVGATTLDEIVVTASPSKNS